MVVDLVYAGLGLVLLIVAGDTLVKGAVNLSLRLGVPALVVGLTIVAFGTSAPELLVSVKAVLENSPGIALGNVIGSNIVNVLVVLGLPALITGLRTEESDTRRTYLMMVGASVLFIALCLAGPLTWLHGLVLLAGLAFLLYDAWRTTIDHRNDTAQRAAEARDEEEVEGADPGMPLWKIALFIVLGLVGLPIGADLLVDASVNFARVAGVSEAVIGLTLVAVGTSLPELAATTVAAVRRQADVALGNVIGSNMFNVLGIIGGASLIGTIPVPPEMLRLDLWVMLASAVLMAPFVFLGWPLNRAWGAVFLAIYAAYTWVLLA